MVEEEINIDPYVLKAVFAVFLIVLIIFTGGMSEKMSALRRGDGMDMLSEDSLYEDPAAIMMGSEDDHEIEMWFIDH